MATNTPTTILLIEDSPSDARLVKELLHSAPAGSFNLITASTLAEGLSRLAANHIDVILLDLSLPDSEERDTFRAVEDRAPSVPIIILTVSTDEALGLEAIRGGAQRFLSKDALTRDGAYAEMFPHVIHFAIEQKRIQAKFLREREEVQRLNKELQSLTEELRIANEGLEQRVEERTKELRETKERLEVYSQQQAILNLIISEGNRAPDLKAALRAMLDTAMKVADVDYGAVYLLNEAEGTIELQYAHGFSEDALRVVRHPPITASNYPQVYEEAPLFIDDYARESTEQLKELVPELHTAAFIPLIAHERPIGHYFLGSSKVRGFSDEEKTLLVAAGYQVGTVVARLQAEQEVQEHARRQDILTRVITAGNKAADLQTACAAMLDTALDLLPLYYGCIFLLDQHTRDAVMLQSSRGYTEKQLEWAQRIPLTQRLTARVMTGTPLFYDNYQVVRSPDAQSMNSEVQSMTFIPLTTGDTVLGFYNLGSRDAQHYFTNEEQNLLIAIGKEAGTVIARLQAEDATRAHAWRATLLNKIIKLGNSTTDIHNLLQYVCDVLTSDLDYDAVDMRILSDNDDRVAEQVAVTGFPAEFNEKFRYLSIDDPILRSVYRGEPYFPSRYTKTHVDLVHATHMASIGIVPLVVGETIIGDMGVALKDYRPFSSDEQALLVAIGHETGTVVARLQAEGQVRAGSRYVRSLIEASLDPLVTISAEGTITDANKATEEVTGYSRDELTGSDFSDYFTEPEKARAGYKTVFTEGFVRDYPLTLRHKSGRVIDVLYNATVYRNEAGEVQGVFAAARDITDRKRAEQELQRYSSHLEDLVEERTAQLKDSERLAAIGQTATMIGHDLRNPLQALQLLVDLAQKFYNDLSPEQKVGFDAATADRIFLGVEKQIQYMDKIVSDLQDYARPLTVELETVQVAAFISDTLGLITIPDSISVNISIVDSVTAKIDPHLMQRALANLVMNAVQAMPQGGELSINAAGEDGALAITIHDAGEGVPENMRETLFSPLTTGKAKGTGLGLAVVKRIIEAHNGTIEFESDEGKGTTFIVTLPQASD